MSPSRKSAPRCIHRAKGFYVGLGHPRCGTGFAASLITTNGLDVGHETVGQNGIVSWMLPGEKYNNPFYDAIGPLARFKNIFLVARSPIASIPSIIPENRRGPSLRFRRTILRERLGHDPIGGVSSANDITRAVASYVNWFELCLRFDPQLIFRVDHEEDDARLSDYLGREIRREAGIHRNSRPEVRRKDFVPADLAEVPAPLLTRLEQLARTLGYEAEAQTIAELRANG